MRSFIAPRQKKEFMRKARKHLPWIALVVVVPLIVALIALLVNNREDPHAATLKAIATAEYVEIDSALSTFDTIGYPNADILGNIMPNLHLHFHAANVLDELIVSQYGERYRLIDPEIYRYVTLTMQEIETAAKQGNSTKQGIENMTAYMMLLSDSLTARFDLNGMILPIQ